MANYHAVYIDSPDSWTYNTDSYDSKLGFYSNAWLTTETEETSETPVISCSYFYELGKQDEVGFTPRRISMNESSGILTVEGKQENVSSLVSKSFRLNSPSPRFLNLRESMRKRRPARFIVNNIITDDDAELNNIKDYLGLNEEEAEAISRSEDFGAEAYEGFEQGNHLIEDKYFYELTEQEGEYWSGGQNKLNPIWGNDSFINALITENLNEEGYSPKFIVDFLLETLKQKERELNIIQRRYKDENIKTFLRRNPFTSRRVMNPDFDDSNDNMMGMTFSEGWGSAWINIAIKSLTQEIDDVYERDMNRYGDMPDGAWDYVGELQEVRKQLKRDRNLVFSVPYDAESFGAEDDVEILYERWKDGELTDEETLSLIDILDYSDSDNDGKMLSHMIRWIEDENSEGMNNLRIGIKERFGAEEGVPEGYHRMPDGNIMADSAHKAEEFGAESPIVAFRYKDDSPAHVCSGQGYTNTTRCGQNVNWDRIHYPYHLNESRIVETLDSVDNKGMITFGPSARKRICLRCYRSAAQDF